MRPFEDASAIVSKKIQCFQVLELGLESIHL